MYVKRETGHKCARSVKSLGFFFLMLGSKRAKNRRRSPDGSSPVRRRKREPLALRRGSHFVSLTKCISIKEHSFLHSKNARRDEGDKGSESRRRARKTDTSPERTWRAFAIMWASGEQTSMLVTLTENVERIAIFFNYKFQCPSGR